MPLALRDLQAAFAAHVAGGDRADLAATVVGDSISAEARLRVYRHHVAYSLGTALAATFPTIQALVGEAFFPSFGVLGVGGIISLAFGSLLLFDTPTSDFGVDRSIVFTAVATLGSFVLAISYLVFRSQKAKPSLGIEGMIGELGVVREKAPLRRAIETSEVGDTAAFLLSNAGRGITGEVIMVDAGYHVIGM